MANVVIDMSMSLDGFVAGPNDSVKQPLGDGGDTLHSWLFNGNTASRHNAMFKLSSKSREVFDEALESTGAILVGRRTYNLVEGWQGSHPIHGVPVFVVTHKAPAAVPKGATEFVFITDGIERAIKQAKSAAGDKAVGVAGASIAQQCLKTGLVDELQIHLVPVLLGQGIRLFAELGPKSIRLEPTRVVHAPGVTHLGYRVQRE